jgi:hypothetical protein
VALLQLCCGGGPVVIVDVAVLGSPAFEREAGLRGLLQDAGTRKLFFDCRADLNALFFHFGVRVPASSVTDLQVLAVAAIAAHAAGEAPRFLPGASPVIADALPVAVAARVRAVRHWAVGLYAQARGGSYSVWHARPLEPVLLEHAAGVQFFAAAEAQLGSALAAAPGAERAKAAAARAVDRRVADAASFAYAVDDRCHVFVDPVFADDLAGRALPPAPECAAPPPPPPPPPVDDSCSLCLDAPRTHTFVPCGHFCVCEPCSKMVRMKCPICRAVATQVIKTFI